MNACVVNVNNTFHVEGVSRRQIKNFTTFSKNVKIAKFHYNIWTHYEKFLKISTNMPSIGSVILKIGFQMCEFEKIKSDLAWYLTNGSMHTLVF